MTPATSDKNLNVYVNTPQMARANRYGAAVRTDSKKTYLAGYSSDELDQIFCQNLLIGHAKNWVLHNNGGP